ncbi:MAG: 50S ribosomal protein L9 [Mariprofundales bacterium]
MQLILLSRIEGLGNVGDEVTVRPGYARNYLLPQELALQANVNNRKLFERRRSVLEARHHTELEQANVTSKAVVELELLINRATSDGTHLYGSVSSYDLADLLKSAGITVARRNILLDHPIKAIGEHKFRVRLHPDVTTAATVQVVSEQS